MMECWSVANRHDHQRSDSPAPQSDRLMASGIRPCGKWVSQKLATLKGPIGSFNVAKAKTDSSVFHRVRSPVATVDLRVHSRDRRGGFLSFRVVGGYICKRH